MVVLELRFGYLKERFTVNLIWFHQVLEVLNQDHLPQKVAAEDKEEEGSTSY